MKALTLFCALMLVTGCARQYKRVRYPFTAEQLAAYPASKGELLMTYLLQQNAAVSVCDEGTHGAHINLVTAEDLADVVDGLHRGVDPQRWRQCVTLLTPGIQPAGATTFFAEMGRAYKALLSDEKLDADRHKLARLEALHQIYLARPVGYGADPETMQKLVLSLRAAVKGNHLSPQGLRYGTELLETLDMERGLYQGGPIDAAALDAIAARRDEVLLRRLSLRLPDATLREQALRRLVRIRIAASPFSEVVAHAAEVESVVVSQGINPVSLEAHPAVGAQVAPGLSMMNVVVRQDLWKHAAELLSESTGHPPTNMPDQDLRPVLTFSLQGVTRPVSLCGPRDTYDPSPCLPSAAVELRNPFVLLEETGTLRFRENVTERDAFAMGGASDPFTMPVVVGGKTLTTIAWALRFERPKDLHIAPKSPGAPGPSLTVDADNHLASRVLYRVTGSAGEFLAVVELRDAAAFHVVAAGAQGESGRAGDQGRPGQSGSDGMNASCVSSGSNGGDGSPGGPGGDGTDGGPGGNGGRAVVRVHCDAAHCGELSRWLAVAVTAPGGKGGEGGAAGQGGLGGAGGRGGSSATCTRDDGSSYTQSGGVGGSRGPDGPSGRRGRNGRAGAPGHVVIETVPLGPMQLRP